MEPLPSINKVFFLIIQEERQRAAAISSSLSIEPIALSVDESRNAIQNRRKEQARPICSHCDKKCHTSEKSYKLHGYPPGFKFRSSSTNASNDSRTIGDNSVVHNGISESSSNFFSSLNSDQCSQLMGLLSSHLQNARLELMNHATGQENFEDDW